MICQENHPPVRLAWEWENVNAYEDWYADPTAYHTDESKKVAGRTFLERHCEYQLAAHSRLDVYRQVIGEPAGRLLLDVGCGLGEFADAAGSAGYDASGIDPWGRYGMQGYWWDVSHQWDVITLHDVLEHLVRPLECLLHLRRHLRPGGFIIVETPEWGSPHQRKEGFLWRHVKDRQHVCLYSREAVEVLFRRTGLEPSAFWRPLLGSIGKMTHVLERYDA